MTGQTDRCCSFHSIFQYHTDICIKRHTILISYRAEKSYNPAVLWSPWQDSECCRVWHKYKVCIKVFEAPNSRSIKGNALFKSNGKLICHYRNIFSCTKNIEKHKPYKLNIIFLDKLQNFFFSIFQTSPSFSHRFRHIRSSPYLSRNPNEINVCISYLLYTLSVYLSRCVLLTHLS